MQRVLTLALLLTACAAPPKEAASPRTTFELVETAPVETTLGSDDLREFQEVWLELIGEARQTIKLAHFYASERAPSRLTPVIEALEAAAARGVRIYFLAEARFAETYPDTLARLDRRLGIEVKLLDLESWTDGVLHAKAMYVDGEVSCVGSANFDWRALEHIQELGALVRSPEVTAVFERAFDRDWGEFHAHDVGDFGRAAPGAEAFPVQLRLESGDQVRVTPVLSPLPLLVRKDSWDLPRLVDWIDGAEEQVLVQLLTYRLRDDGWTVLDDALRRAARRGVAVRLLVADWGKRRGTVEGLQALVREPGVEVRFASLPQAAQGHIPYARVVHAKYMVADGRRSWIGTSNWERGYFHASRNVGLLVEGRSSGERLQRFFADVWDSAYAEEVDPDATYEPPRIGD